MNSLRCFVAVELDDPARRDVGGVIERLRATGADVKWVAPGNLHLTLKFLGAVPAGDVPKVVEALHSALGDGGPPAPFAFRLSGVGAFPSAASPRVVWVGVTQGQEPLVALAARVEAALEPLGFPRESRPFSPHLTVGRCRSPKNGATLGESIVSLRAYEGPPVAVGRVVLFSSDLRPTGPVYTPLATFSL